MIPAEIEGRILSRETNEPIAYSDIYNKTLQRGTISNVDGYFKIVTQNEGDSIYITSIGYKKERIILRDGIAFYTIYLQQSVQVLSEVIVVPGNDSYLFDLLDHCIKNSSTARKEAKAYFETKSFTGDQQVELVEGYYNADIWGYDLAALDLKAGRLALQPHNNRFFVSLESSKAVMMPKLPGKNSYFPDSPLDLSKPQMKKSYYLALDGKYLDNEVDSIYIIDYRPKHATGLLFEGKIWIDKTKYHIIKIDMNCNRTRRHPFLPLFSSDSITNVNFAITKSFKELNGEMLFNHIDFTYTIDYKSRIAQAYQLAYSIRTNVVLHVYDFDHTFFIPKFEYSASSSGDYRKINAMPYNAFFWNYNDEYGKHSSNGNQEYYL